MAMYTITVYTSDMAGAGTDCTAYISVHGKRGDTGKQVMTVGAGAFARGSVETALVEGPDVGEMLCICVGHNDEGAHSFIPSFISALISASMHSSLHLSTQIHSLTPLLTPLLTHSLTPSLTHSLTPSLTHSCHDPICSRLLP